MRIKKQKIIIIIIIITRDFLRWQLIRNSGRLGFLRIQYTVKFASSAYFISFSEPWRFTITRI